MLSSSNMRRIKGRIVIAAMILLQLLICIFSSHALSITTFNILAPVHRSMGVEREMLLNGLDPLCPSPPSYYNDDDDINHRESEREDWWRPRAEGVADYIAKRFSSSDVVLLQEWWFDEKFISIFNSKIGDTFDIISERRPGRDGKMRDDGMCCLIRKDGQLELVKSDKVLTGLQRIAQIVQCRERCKDGSRDVFVANSHLSYPGHEDPDINNEQQEKEAGIILEALKRASSEWETTNTGEESLEVVCGDFNSNSCGFASKLCEMIGFVNCQSAVGEQMLTSIGGQVNVGVTHCDHLGKRVSVDHIFLRLNKLKQNTKQKKDKCAALALGYLDTKGTRIVCVRCDDIELEGNAVLSDHRPVTAKIAWPRATDQVKEILSSDMYLNVTRPLDPLEPAWGIIDE